MKIINGIEINPLQIPYKDNNYHGICSAIITSNDGSRVTALGEAFGDNATQKVLEDAGKNALNNALEMKNIHNVKNENNVLPITPPPSTKQQYIQKDSRAKNPISDKQIGLIQKTATQKNLSMDTVESLSEEAFGCQLNELNTKQAHSLFKKLEAI